MSCREDWFEKKHSKCWDHKKHSKCWDDHHHSKRCDDKHHHDDDCWKKFHECKKDRNEKCDCCCTTGIFQALRSLRGRTVAIAIRGVTVSVIGIVESVNCDVVTLRGAGTARPLTLSICEIIAVRELIVAVSETPAENLNVFDINN
ncbi:hypothetical protein [Bacillus gaemokensis]|uniref:hypothetical protein n=1 Tax=Bacillus gaemokensis TaxID=574375 RepID=UPI000A6B001E|nr:hypothetical protein [Bacillus gaemokensis]